MELFYESCPRCKNPGRSIRDLKGHFRCQTCGHDLGDKRPLRLQRWSFFKAWLKYKITDAVLCAVSAVILLFLAALLTGCGPTCIKAGGWGMNLEICWEGEQPPTVKNLKEGDDAEPDAPDGAASEGSTPTR